MKTTKQYQLLSTFAAALVLLLIALASATSALAADRWWDGTNNAAAGDGVGQGGGAGWGSSNTNWDQGLGLDHTNWVNAAEDTAVFEGAPGTVSITHGNGVTVSALIFQTNGYTLDSIAPERAVNCRSGGIITYVNVASNATATINAIITNGPSSGRQLQVGGRGTLVLNGSNMFNGQIIIGNNAPANGSTAIFVNGNGSGQTPTVQASIIADLGVASSLGMQFTEANGTIQIGDASTSGILEYTGTNAASTDRKVAIGSSSGGSGSATIRNNNADPNHTLTFSNPAFNAPATGVGSFNRTLTLAGTNTGNNTIAGSITNNVGGSGGTNSITKSGSGTWVLAGSNTYSGATTVSGGVLKLDNANALPGGIGASGGTSALVLNGGGVVGLTANSGNFTRTNGSGADQVRWTGSGGFAAYGGTRTVKLSASAQNWTATALIGNGNALILGAANADATLDWQQGLSFAGAARTVRVDDGSAAIDAIMSGTLSGGSGGNSPFIKTGSGTLAFTGANTYSGQTTISNGTLVVGNGGTSGRLSVNSASTFVDSGATLAVNRSDAISQAVGGGLGDGSAVISGAGGFSQLGSGTTTLALANTYTGPTLISGGTLLVTNTTGSGTGTGDVSVNSGGTLGGTGSIAGVVTNNTGGTLAPGASIGTLTLNGNVVLNAGSTNTFEVDGTTPTNDEVVLGSTVTYGGVLKIVPTGSFTNGQTFTLFSGAGATSLSNFGSPVVVDPPVSGTSFTFTNGVLTAVVAPAGPSGPATLTNSVSGSTLTFNWPSGESWRLVGQTNSRSTGLNPATNAWFTVPGGIDGSNSITINPANPTVFYRLVWP